jgi:hypothetical protein
MWEAIVKISWVYFLSCAIVLCGAFRSPLSLQVPESVDQTLKGIQGFPLGIVVRGGESERGRLGTSLEEGPEKVAFHFAPFWLPFRRSKIVLKKQCPKYGSRAPQRRPKGVLGEDLIDFGTILASIWAPFWEPSAS